MRFLKVVPVLLGLGGCVGLDLDTPPGTVVSCAENADCRGNLVCAPRLNICVTEIDEEGPRVVSAVASSPTTARISVSEALNRESAESSGSYTILPSLGVQAASLSDDGQTITLVTDSQGAGVAYTVNVTSILDRALNPVESDQSSAGFVGFGIPPDTSPPDLLSPADNSRTEGEERTLVWSLRAGASSYEVEVARDAAFADQIAGSPFTVLAPQSSLMLSGLDDITYHWRVRADITDVGIALPIASFDVLIDTVYVYCPAGEICEDGSVQNGSRTRPYRSVSSGTAAAIVLTTALGFAPQVWIAARGADEAYDDAVALNGTAIDIRGGYSPDFQIRDADLNRTLIQSDGSTMKISNVVDPMVVEGVELVSVLAGALILEQSTSDLVLRDVVATAMGTSALTPGAPLTVQGGAGAGPRLERCTINALGTSGNVTAVTVSQAAPELRDCDVTVAHGGDRTVALSITGPIPADVMLVDSRVLAGDALRDARGVSSFEPFGLASSGRIVIRDSRVVAGDIDPNGEASYAVDLSDMGLLVDGSRLQAGTGVIYSVGINVNEVGRVEVINSIVSGGDAVAGNGTSAGISMWLSGATEDDERAALITNSVVSAASAPGTLSAIYSREAHPVVVNSILFNWSGGGICFEESVDDPSPSTYSEPSSFQNNVMLDCAGAAYLNVNNGSVELLTDGAAIDALDGDLREAQGCGGASEPACETSRYSGNVVLAGTTIADLFEDPDGADNDPFTISDNDLRPVPAQTVVTQGGKDSTLMDCGTQETAQSCGDVVLDLEGTTRTTPVSVGAYEVDP